MSFRFVPCLEAICLAIAKISRFMKQRRHVGHHRRNIEVKALARHSLAQDFKIAQDNLLDCFSLEFC